jgi:hypothetical protein
MIIIWLKGAKPRAEGLASVLAAVLGIGYIFIHMSRLQELKKKQRLTPYEYLFYLYKVQVSVEGQDVIRLNTPFAEEYYVCIPLWMRYNWCRCF